MDDDLGQATETYQRSDIPKVDLELRRIWCGDEWRDHTIDENLSDNSYTRYLVVWRQPESHPNSLLHNLAFSYAYHRSEYAIYSCSKIEVVEKERKSGRMQKCNSNFIYLLHVFYDTEKRSYFAFKEHHDYLIPNSIFPFTTKNVLEVFEIRRDLVEVAKKSQNIKSAD